METFEENMSLAEEKIWGMIEQDRRTIAVKPDSIPGRSNCQIKSR
jgi:hypothetical protein